LKAKKQKIGNLELKNQFIMAPVKTGYGTLQGNVSEQHLNYYRRRAQGGVSMIICEPFFIHPSGKELPTQIGIHTDELLPDLKSLVQVVHEEGAAVTAHINHAGRAANPKIAGDSLMAPSAIPCPTHGVTPKEMTESDIKQVIEWFASASQRAKQAGFDAVEIQFGLGYIAHQFFSPATNLRMDGWGNRIRFSIEMLTAVRNAVGNDYPLIGRISGNEFRENGTTIEDSTFLAQTLEKNGINAIHVTNGSACDSPPVYYQFFTFSNGQNQNAAIAIKKKISVPVISTGRLGDPQQIIEIFNKGEIDFVGMGRPMVADPDLPKKILQDNEKEIIRCGYCLQGCLANVKALNGLKCVVNPEVGREYEFDHQPVDKPKNVIVIGGGPAGIKAAITADKRGHNVELFEKEKNLGGQFALSFLAPHKDGMKILHEDLLLHLSESNVKVHLGEAFSADKAKALNPDTIILATGAIEKIVPLPGLDKIEYYTGFNIYTLENWDSVKKAVVIGGGLIGMEAAEFIAMKNINTTVIEILPEVAADMEMISRKLLMKRISELPVEIKTESEIQKIEKGKIIYKQNDQINSIDNIDLIVIATGTQAVTDLEEPLVQKGIPVIKIGDADKPAKIYEAIHSGFFAGINI